MDSLSNRQREIVLNALTVISNDGIQNFTIKKLANEIGLTEGALYKHFKSKDDIIMLLLSLFEQTFLDINYLTSEHYTSSFEQLECFFEEKFKRVSGHPELVVVMDSMDLFRGNETFTRQFHKLLHKYKSDLTKIIEDSQKNRKIRDDLPSEHIYWIIIGAIHFLMKKWARNNYDFNIRKEGEKLWLTIKKLIET